MFKNKNYDLIENILIYIKYTWLKIYLSLSRLESRCKTVLGFLSVFFVSSTSMLSRASSDKFLPRIAFAKNLSLELERFFEFSVVVVLSLFSANVQQIPKMTERIRTCVIVASISLAVRVQNVPDIEYQVLYASSDVARSPTSFRSNTKVAL